MLKPTHDHYSRKRYSRLRSKNLRIYNIIFIHERQTPNSMIRTLALKSVWEVYITHWLFELVSVNSNIHQFLKKFQEVNLQTYSSPWPSFFKSK